MSESHVEYPPSVLVAPLNGLLPAAAEDIPTVPNKNATTRIERITIAFILFISSLFKYEYRLIGALNKYPAFSPPDCLHS
jgi:hypothetical protein